jgi:PKD repeat protein
MRSRLFPYRVIFPIAFILLVVIDRTPLMGGVLRGTVTDATNGRPLAGATVSIAGLSTLSNASGAYSIGNLPRGTLAAQFAASPLRGVAPLRVQFTDQSSESAYTIRATLSGFIEYANQILAIGPNDTATLNISLSPSLAAGQMRIVLRWSANPRDLDAHLLANLNSGQQFHIFFGNKGRANALPFDTLDVDDTDGFGPETITMYQLFPGRYVYYVHRFFGTDSLRNSQAVAEVYTAQGLVQTIQIPTTGSGDYWHVCEINGGTGAITLVNQIVPAAPTNAPDGALSTKTYNTRTASLHAARIVSWVWDFGDGERDTVQNPSHIYRRSGIYTVSLTVRTESGSESITTRRSFVTVTSPFTVLFREPSIAGTDQSFSITPPPGANVTSGVLLYRQAGRRTYDSLTLTSVAGSLEGIIPATAMTIRGLEYFVRMIGAQGVLTFPETFPAEQPAVYLVPFTSTTSPVALTPRKFAMVSVPVSLTDPTPSSVFSDDFGSYNPSLWRLFRWNDTVNSEFPQVPLCRPGTAFWLITANATQFDADNGTSVTSERPFALTLRPGWNQIATPFAFSVAWDSIVGVGNLTRPYAFNGVEYQPDIRVLKPWEGYFVFNNFEEQRTLLVPPIEAQTTQVIERTANANDEVYRLHIVAHLAETELRDSYTSFGLLGGDVANLAQFNYREPPPMSEHLQVCIVENAISYMSFSKRVPQEGTWWDFEIRSSQRGHVEWTIDERGTLPHNFRPHIFDLDAFASLPFEERRFTTHVDKSRHFRLMIGTEEYLRVNSRGIPLQPVEYALEQNYPNPFNPTTTIRYQLKRRSNVTLEIFDVVGRLVRTLVNGEQLTGAHAAIWDGTNEVGIEASSGVYFYRLRANDFTMVRKLLLVK